MGASENYQKTSGAINNEESTQQKLRPRPVARLELPSDEPSPGLSRGSHRRSEGSGATTSRNDQPRNDHARDDRAGA